MTSETTRMRTRLAPTVALLLSMGVLAACETTPQEYPVSHETCAPGDPVQTLDSNDCKLPGM
ncbi:MAG: hypothetical protein EP336_18360 [Rhodobacteraceae bacterium]|uniref:hypothetical protein n=1 Tax=Celeribacter ethanolicus TaxID=1758178 RepID=UPI0012FDF916|nr:hypothetical protein [Celeribacter ethanolicus]TNE62915.1 MAG: hypothetical protein EP336_18360 [Paracoccaceae bacterium]